MRVGCGYNDDRLGQDEQLLRKYHCDCLVLTPSTMVASNMAALRAIRLLNRGDSLVVARLDRLGDVASIAVIASELSKRGAQLEVLDETFTAGENGSELFLKGCTTLQTLLGLELPPEIEAHGPPKRGRPPVVTPQQISRAYRYLSEGKTVAETAKLLHVSSSTLYRKLSKPTVQSLRR